MAGPVVTPESQKPERASHLLPEALGDIIHLSQFFNHSTNRTCQHDKPFSRIIVIRNENGVWLILARTQKNSITTIARSKRNNLEPNRVCDIN